MTRWAFVLTCLTWTWPGWASPPSIWERAADAGASPASRAHRMVGELLLEARGFGAKTPMGKERLEAAERLVLRVLAEHPADPRLLFDAGHVASLLGQDERAVALTLEALDRAPASPQATDAYFLLAVSYAKVNQPEKEIAAYDAYLRRETELGARAVAMSNRAEAFMVRGDLPLAVDGFRAALQLQPSDDSRALTYWNLAVALDRMGDHPAAMAESIRALRLDPTDKILDDHSMVFFIPDYDLFYYKAIGAMARARDAAEPSAARMWLRSAIQFWDEYLNSADPSDRWILAARQRRRRCEGEWTRLGNAHPENGAKPAEPLSAKGKRGGSPAP